MKARSIALIISIILMESCGDPKMPTPEGKPATTEVSELDFDSTSDYENEDEEEELEDDSTLKDITIGTDLSKRGRVVIMDGYEFNVVEKDGDTLYIETMDKEFHTPEGYSVGTFLSELPPDIQSNFIKEEDWGYYYELPSGWKIAICVGHDCTSMYPKLTSKIGWIFKRDEKRTGKKF